MVQVFTLKPFTESLRLASLIQQCWNDNPDTRPTFKEVITYLLEHAPEVSEKSERENSGFKRTDNRPTKKHSPMLSPALKLPASNMLDRRHSQPHTENHPPSENRLSRPTTGHSPPAEVEEKPRTASNPFPLSESSASASDLQSTTFSKPPKPRARPKSKALPQVKPKATVGKSVCEPSSLKNELQPRSPVSGRNRRAPQNKPTPDKSISESHREQPIEKPAGVAQCPTPEKPKRRQPPPPPLPINNARKPQPKPLHRNDTSSPGRPIHSAEEIRKLANGIRRLPPKSLEASTSTSASTSGALEPGKPIPQPSVSDELCNQQRVPGAQSESKRRRNLPSVPQESGELPSDPSKRRQLPSVPGAPSRKTAPHLREVAAPASRTHVSRQADTAVTQQNTTQHLSNTRPKAAPTPNVAPSSRPPHGKVSPKNKQQARSKGPPKEPGRVGKAKPKPRV